MNPRRWALALIVYNNPEYSSRVLDSILAQVVDGQAACESFDLFIFQDGLQDRHADSRQAHEAVTRLSVGSVPPGRFIRQDTNLGIARHYAVVEERLFLDEVYDFVVFCEQDMVLGPGYLQEVASLAIRFQDDPRVSMVSAHSCDYRASPEQQQARRSDYVLMGHRWGAGIFRSAWLSWKPLREFYLALLGDKPYHQRDHQLIQQWQAHCGFRSGPTSQDYLYACISTALRQLRITRYPNFGLYIGAVGEHFNPEQYEQAGYGQTVLYAGETDTPSSLDTETYVGLLAEQAAICLTLGIGFDFWGFQQRMESGELMIDIPASVWIPRATEADIAAACRLLLGQTEENPALIRQFQGKSMASVLRSFLLSEEFLNRRELWPLLVEVAKRIMQRAG